MATLLGSFLIRRWSLADGEERVEIEHVQSGARVVAPTIDEALSWIRTQSDDTHHDGQIRPRAPASELLKH
jgi:hypothetical protein